MVQISPRFICKQPLSKFRICSGKFGFIRSAGREMSSSVETIGWRSSVADWLIGAVVCLLTASCSTTRKHSTLRYNLCNQLWRSAYDDEYNSCKQRNISSRRPTVLHLFYFLPGRRCICSICFGSACRWRWSSQMSANCQPVVCVLISSTSADLTSPWSTARSGMSKLHWFDLLWTTARTLSCPDNNVWLLYQHSSTSSF